MRKNFTQKFRHEVAIQRFASPRRDAAPRDLEEFWLNRHSYPRAVNVEWQDAGPCNFSGRTTCLATDPKSLFDAGGPRVLYAGTAAGGLWKSEDGGKSWASCWPSSLNQSIGAVAVYPDDDCRIICATGEGNLASASYPGSGIYESDDAGFTWRLFGFTAGQRRHTAEVRDSFPRRVVSISFSAFDPDLRSRKVAFGSVSNDEELPGGLYYSKPNQLLFETWWSTRPYNCYSAVYHPTDPGTLYVSIEAGGTLNGIWRTRDSGQNWHQLTAGLPPGENCGRISLAIGGEKFSQVLYALVSSPPTGGLRSGNKGANVLGVFRTKDGGDTWSPCSDPNHVFAKEGHLDFNNTIAIHPEDPKLVVCGAQGLFLTEDGGEVWRSIASRGPGAFNYVHSDQHAILMTGGKRIFVANDGGVFKSTNLGETEVRQEQDELGLATGKLTTVEKTAWEESYHGMNTIMFYAIDVAQSSPGARIYGGGTQDNGMLIAGVNEGKGLADNRRKKNVPFVRCLAGDGGYLVFDLEEEELAFGSNFGTDTPYHQRGKAWGVDRGGWVDASPPVSLAERSVIGLTVMAIRQPKGKGKRQLLLGTNRVWIGVRDKKAMVWKPSASNFDGSAITAIEISSANPDVVYVGTARGGIFRSDDGGQLVWTEDLAGPEIPNHVVTQMETHPLRAEELIITMASTSRTAITLNDNLPRTHPHVFRSSDSGHTWEELDPFDEKTKRRQLPNVVLNGLAFETRPPYRLFVGGDAGPWMLDVPPQRAARLPRWVSIAGGMPSAVISDIIYHRKSKSLFAGTYGRGMWRLKLPDQFEIDVGRDDLDADSSPVEGFLLDRFITGPEPLAPPNGQVLARERLTNFSCQPVKGATGYSFEVLIENQQQRAIVKSSPNPTVAIDLLGGREFSWRCWALFQENSGAGDRCSMPSPVMRFGFAR